MNQQILKNSNVRLSFLSLVLSIVFSFIPFSASFAMPPGTILYRTTDGGKMFGYSGHPLIDFWNGIATGINPGHVGIYVGEEEGISYVVEALSGGVVKTPLETFVNEAAGEKLLGAKIPQNLSPLQQLKAVDLAKRLAVSDLAYDFDFKKQKGPGSGEWTCVGLVEKIYESANTSNPLDITSLEYDSNRYAINITPDGFDNYSFYNKEGDCFSRDKEFSLVARKTETILPFPEEKGFNAGLIYKAERYIFFPYTQFLQNSLEDVVVDKKVSSSFKSSEIRGKTKAAKVLLRWSLINNPISALKVTLFETKEKIASLFSGKNDDILIIDENEEQELKEQIALGKNNLNQVGGSADSKINSAKISVNQNPVNNTQAESAKENKISTEIIKEKNVQEDFNFQGNTEPELEARSSQITGVDSAPEAILNSAPLQTVTNQIILKPLFISKIYSTGKNDFVEIYNPNDVAVDLLENNYRLEKTKTAVDPSLMIRIGNSADGSYPGGTLISARGYYLIVRDDASDYYLNLASAIATRSEFDLSGNNQSVYLGLGAISSYEDEDIVDAVGCGSGALYYRGLRPALKINDYYFLNRVAFTNNNFTDFNLLLSAEPAAVLAWQQEQISEAQENNKEESNIVNQPSSVLSTTSSQVLVVASSTATSTTAVVATSTDLVATSTNPISSTSVSIDEAVLKESYRKVLIEKVAATSYNDFISLHNYSDIDIDLATAEFRLEKTKTALDPGILMRLGNIDDGSYPGGTLLKSGESYLIVRDDADAYFLNQADAIATRSDFNLFSSGYSLYLASAAVSSPDDEDIIDVLGYGPDSLFYDGLSPAPKIEEGYYLQRTGRSNNNYADFINVLDNNLLSSSSPLNINDFGLFIPPSTQNSEGIMNLWHFDDCYGDYGGLPVVGKWDCGRKIGLNFGALSFDLAQSISLEKLSLSFYFHPSQEGQFAGFVLNGSNGNNFSVKYEEGLITVFGIPGNHFFYLDNMSLSQSWHQMTVVVNQPEDYYAIYVDGQEILKEFFLSRLPQVSSLDIYDGGSMMFIDEVVIWPRALEPDEVKDIFRTDRAFAPVNYSRPAQQGPELKYSWNFEEDMGTVATDSVSAQTIEIPSNFWMARAHDNYAIRLYYPALYANLGESQRYLDFSMSFWWKDLSYPQQGRSVIYLYEDNGSSQISSFAFSLDVYNRSIFMNNEWHLISQSLTDVLNDDGAWHFVTATYDSYRQVFRLFIDGEEKLNRPMLRMKEGSEKFNTIKFVPESGDIAIDEFRLYSGVLSTSDIWGLYNTSKIE